MASVPSWDRPWPSPSPSVQRPSCYLGTNATALNDAPDPGSGSPTAQADTSTASASGIARRTGHLNDLGRPLRRMTFQIHKGGTPAEHYVQLRASILAMARLHCWTARR